jgi:hypothetical protein
MVSPGLWGFVAFFVLAVALYLLMRNMNARMRRMSYRAEELQREVEAEAAAKKSRTDGAGARDAQQPEGPSDTGDEGGAGEQTGDPRT